VASRSGSNVFYYDIRFYRSALMVSVLRRSFIREASLFSNFPILVRDMLRPSMAL
jgi:hypothetical protein